MSTIASAGPCVEQKLALPLPPGRILSNRFESGVAAQKRWPWPSWHCSAIRNCACASVSMPSATMRRPNAMAERDGRAAHGARLVIVADLFDERTVDHDAVERRAAQLAERHVAGAEVVDEHAHTLAAQLVQRREAGAARGQHLFGDLEIELRRLDAGFLRRSWRRLRRGFRRTDTGGRRSPRRAGAGSRARPASRGRGRRGAAPSGRAAPTGPRARRSAGIPRWARCPRIL